MLGEIEDKVQLSQAEAEIGTDLGVTENHSKHLVGVKFVIKQLLCFFFVVSILFWVGG